MSLDDPNTQKRLTELYSGNHPTFCGCCNGTFSSSSMTKSLDENKTIQSWCNELANSNQTTKIFRFEYNRNTNKFITYGPDDQKFNEFDMGAYNYKENIVFVVMSNGTPDFSFSLVP